LPEPKGHHVETREQQTRRCCRRYTTHFGSTQNDASHIAIAAKNKEVLTQNAIIISQTTVWCHHEYEFHEAKEGVERKRSQTEGHHESREPWNDRDIIVTTTSAAAAAAREWSSSSTFGKGQGDKTSHRYEP
jgi:hypothetical protein